MRIICKKCQKVSDVDTIGAEDHTIVEAPGGWKVVYRPGKIAPELFCPSCQQSSEFPDVVPVWPDKSTKKVG